MPADRSPRPETALAAPKTEPLITARREEIFPVLTVEQRERVQAHGHRRTIQAGEILVEVGSTELPFFLVCSGQIDIVRPAPAGETLITRHGPGEFSGEVSVLSGRGAVVRARAATTGDVVELSRAELMSLVQTDAELSEILMRAFILRRLELVNAGLGDVILVGSLHSPGTLRIKEFLTRNGHPHAYIDLDTDPGVQALLDSFGVGVDDVPVVICRGTTALRNPDNAQIAEVLGFNAAINTHLRDVVVIGAGPAGLAAAVYGASEGLDVLVIESNAPGGQAGASSRIENYLGFPTGLSGQQLGARAYDQAQKFGAQIMIARDAQGLSCARRPYEIGLGDGAVPARAVVIATGAQYRRLPLANLAQFENCGVYFSATFLEKQYCKGEDVIVVGGGNSAGQAAVFLSQHSHVHMLVRGAGLSETMSRYLIRRIEESPSITLHTRTGIVALEGHGALERVTWRDGSGAESTHDIRHVFLMMGADPCTAWLKGCVALDERGFIRTGPDLTKDDLERARWPLPRAPYLLETSLPGVFAVGDVRANNVKRVASAVGEGSIAISFVHRVLGE